MKVRNGFVSNSSSTSFLVVFREVPKTADELAIMLGSGINRDVVEFVFEDLKRLKSVGKKRALDLAKQATGCPGKIEFRSRPILTKTSTKENFEDYENWVREYRMAENDFISSYADNFIKRYIRQKGFFIYLFEYEDKGGGIGSAIECGNVRVFEKLDHILISHH